MGLKGDELKKRAMLFGISILRLVDRLPLTVGAQVVGRQVARSATSVGANYVAACNARSRTEFIAKLGIVNEESDETVHWLDVIRRVPYLPVAEVTPLWQEAIELRAIFGRSVGTARRNERQRRGGTMTQPNDATK